MQGDEYVVEHKEVEAEIRDMLIETSIHRLVLGS
jgi:hypothetical protein